MANPLGNWKKITCALYLTCAPSTHLCAFRREKVKGHLTNYIKNLMGGVGGRVATGNLQPPDNLLGGARGRRKEIQPPNNLMGGVGGRVATGNLQPLDNRLGGARGRRKEIQPPNNLMGGVGGRVATGNLQPPGSLGAKDVCVKMFQVLLSNRAGEQSWGTSIPTFVQTNITYRVMSEQHGPLFFLY